MKIIAHMNNHKYLVEMDLFELRELDSELKLEIGTEYSIRKAAETLSSLRSLSSSKLKYLKNNIDDLQKKFKEIEDAYDAVMLLDTIKHSGDKNE